MVVLICMYVFSSLMPLLHMSLSVADLFSQAILMSGAGTAAWNVGDSSIPVTFQLAEVLECDLPSHAQMLDCLRTKSVPEIQEAYQSFVCCATQQRHFAYFITI